MASLTELSTIPDWLKQIVGGGSGGGGGGLITQTGSGGGKGSVGGAGKDIVPRNMQQVALRNMQQVGEYTGKGAGKVGLKGILGPAAMAYEGGDTLNNMFGKPAWDRAQIAAEEGQTRRAMEADPELATRGAASVDKVGTQAMDGVRGLMAQGDQLNKDNAQIYQPAPGVQTPMGTTSFPAGDPNAAPQAPPEVAKAIQARQVEATRQQLQSGAQKGLQTGQTSVSQLAQGVVQADAQRAGKTLTPEEQSKAVTAEIQTLKTMPQSDMAKYVSYALVAGGLLAAALDKSGQAGDAFGQSFNKQLDRNLMAGKMNLQAQQAAVKAAQEDRKIDNTEKDINSKIQDRTHGQGIAEKNLLQGDEKIEIAKGNLGVAQSRAATDASQGAARIGLMGEANSIKREGINSREKIAAARLAAAGSNDKGVPLSYKDSEQVVEQVYSGAGANVSSELKSQLAARLPTLQKKYPQMSVAELVELAQSEYQTEAKAPWYTSKKTVRQKKGE